MIRHVSVFTLKPGADIAQIEEGFAALCDLVPGILGAAYGRDLGLREGNSGYATSFDFEDEAAYQAWDQHPDHQRVRRELILPNITGVQRAQIRVG
ncbi:MAG: Dabb family protein [Chloroflexota bacterium]|nr:Dabb family protein [Chloroflexota bacterium]